MSRVGSGETKHMTISQQRTTGTTTAPENGPKGVSKFRQRLPES